MSLERVKAWHLIVGALAVAIAVGGWGIVGLGDKVDIPQLESEIRDEFANQLGGSPSDYDAGCPSSVDWETGEDFRCIVENVDGERARVTVYMESDDGSYTWAVE